MKKERKGGGGERGGFCHDGYTSWRPDGRPCTLETKVAKRAHTRTPCPVRGQTYTNS